MARITQKEIARLAGVSQATVSFVLNGSTADHMRIPHETRDRILKVIQETGYVANPVARRMAKGRNKILGVFTYEAAFPRALADFFAPFLFGIEVAAQSKGYDLLLMTSAARTEDGRKQLFDGANRLKLADGCLLLGRQFDSAELARLLKEEFPFVAVGRRDDPTPGAAVPYVGADYAAATKSLVALAQSLGHQRFAFVGVASGAESIADRWSGFRDGLATENAELVLHIDEEGAAPDKLLPALQSSGATVVYFTELADAIPFRRAALDAGLSVPGDLSIIVLGSHIRPGDTGTDFTTYTIPREQMAQQATLALIARLEGQNGTAQTLLPCDIVEGETLGSPLPREMSKT